MVMKKINYILFLCLLCFLLNEAKSQTRMVLNNNSFLVIDNAAYLIIDNANANALTTLGTGGNIISENETDVIKWNIGALTGNYVIPWTTASGVKIPLEINKTTTGTGAGNFILSTYETTTDMNTPYPSAVTNMNSSPPVVDESLWVVDRFWHIDARSYSVKPTVTMIINYDPAANETGITNTINQTNLLAQRFNTSIGSWQSLLFGTNDAFNTRVTGITISSADFFEDWILVDQTHPLPVTLTEFNATCKQENIIIDWTTATEINNDYFIVEKSYDAINFFELAQVQGAGNSNVANHYSIIDLNPTSGTSYYRLKQVDFDGTTAYHQIIASNCTKNKFDFNQFILNNNSLSFNISTSFAEKINIYFYDYRSRLISSKVQSIVKGNNQISLNNLAISTGIYMLSVQGKNNSFSTKLMNNKN